MTLNGVIPLILRYFSEFGSFRAHCVKVVEDVAVKKFTFAISSPDEFLVTVRINSMSFPWPVDSALQTDQIRRQLGRH